MLENTWHEVGFEPMIPGSPVLCLTTELPDQKDAPRKIFGTDSACLESKNVPGHMISLPYSSIPYNKKKRHSAFSISIKGSD